MVWFMRNLYLFMGNQCFTFAVLQQRSTSFLSFPCLTSVIIAPKAKTKPKPKQSPKCKDDNLAAQLKEDWMLMNTQANQLHAGITNDLLLPAMEYFKGLDHFSDRAAPSPLT